LENKQRLLRDKIYHALHCILILQITKPNRRARGQVSPPAAIHAMLTITQCVNWSTYFDMCCITEAMTSRKPDIERSTGGHFKS